jgi:hypothetical protein
MLDDIFYEGKPFFYKATQNIKQLTRKRQLLLNNSTTLHRPERSYQIQPHLQHKQPARENKQHPTENKKSQLS